MDKRKRRKIIRTVIIVVVPAVVLAVVLKLACRPPEKTPLEAMELTPGNIVSTVSADGELEALNQVDISAEVVAKIEKLYVEEGDEVKKGQLLCTLDDDEYRFQRDLYYSQLEQAKATYERGRTLFEEGLLSEADFDTRRTDYAVARSHYEQSQDDLSKTRIYSPIAGRVVAVEVEEGETVVMGTMNNAGTVMFTVGDLSAMQALIYVDETDVADLAVGQPSVVTLDAMPDSEFAAVVSSIGYMPSDEGDATTDATEFEVVLDLTDADPRLRPGMTVDAEITTSSCEGVITCPLQALGKERIDGKMHDTVFLLDGGRVKVTPVKTGISDGTYAEITEGLESGQVIITGPYRELRELQDGDVVEDVIVSEGGEGWPSGTAGKSGVTTRGMMRAMRRR
ncbi:MAG: efflux RND transporter periplasmic adaptor subunit [Candidatus Zixiibacteriota bacterium]|jgi:HlyD family secretion protein